MCLPYQRNNQASCSPSERSPQEYPSLTLQSGMAEAVWQPNKLTFCQIPYSSEMKSKKSIRCIIFNKKLFPANVQRSKYITYETYVKNKRQPSVSAKLVMQQSQVQWGKPFKQIKVSQEMIKQITHIKLITTRRVFMMDDNDQLFPGMY